MHFSTYKNKRNIKLFITNKTIRAEISDHIHYFYSLFFFLFHFIYSEYIDNGIFVHDMKMKKKNDLAL